MLLNHTDCSELLPPVANGQVDNSLDVQALAV
jgi:hypothetical protein